VSWNRRELLGGLGSATAALILGCHLPQRDMAKPIAPSDAVRAWLRDAVAWLAPAFPEVHALAVSRRRITASLDALGSGVARSRFDGVVLSVRDKTGRREQMSSELSATGVSRAVLSLVGTTKASAGLGFGGAPVIVRPKLAGDPAALEDRDLIRRLDPIAADLASSRIIYAAALLDIDDATTWSVAPDHDREQRVVRVRRIATRVAWNGTRPVVGEATRAWVGGVDAGALSPRELHRAALDATELMTPGAFADGEHELLLEPSVAAAAVDAAVRALFTARALRRPEVAGRPPASPLISLVDDPTAPGAYGGYAFDDAGSLAAPLALVEAGKVTGALGAGRERRPGHVGPLAAMPSHLRLVPGGGDPEAMLATGFVLEGGGAAVVDASSDRITLGVARARERAAGAATGRVYADVELVGSLSALLASVSELSAPTATFGMREELEGEPTWRSIEVPWLRLRGTVRARRRPA